MDKFNIPVVKKLDVVKNIEAPVTITEDLEVTADNGMMPILGNFCAAVILLVATVNTSGDMNTSMKLYANTVGAFAMILSPSSVDGGETYGLERSCPYEATISSLARSRTLCSTRPAH